MKDPSVFTSYRARINESFKQYVFNNTIRLFQATVGQFGIDSFFSRWNWKSSFFYISLRYPPLFFVYQFQHSILYDTSSSSEAFFEDIDAWIFYRLGATMRAFDYCGRYTVQNIFNISRSCRINFSSFRPNLSGSASELELSLLLRATLQTDPSQPHYSSWPMFRL